jgi:formylglycine-generating enzyme required for sulfatase activity
MHGSVQEWRKDYCEWDFYAQSPTHDPSGPMRGERRVLRGGAWGHALWNCRSATRRGGLQTGCASGFGFRAAAVLADE